MVLNAGSSSLKFDIFELQHLQQGKLPKRLIRGNISQIGAQASLEYSKSDDHSSNQQQSNEGSSDKKKFRLKEPIKTHSDAIKNVLELLHDNGVKQSNLAWIGHRVVHGGMCFTKDHAYKVDDEVLHKIDALGELAPLHNRANLQGIKETMEVFDNVPQIAVFDTTFHASIPPVAYKYALPSEESGLGPEVRKFGFHGISYRYITSLVNKYFLENVDDLGRKPRIVALHLGNGCSACAIKDGVSIDTSMGMTPLQGLTMGSRTGDIDPATVFHIVRKYGKNLDEVEKMMNRSSGLKGICGENDMRIIVKNKENNEKMKLAFDLFCYHIRQYIGKYHVTLGGADAIVFTGGIGENSAEVREDVCQGLACLGVKIDVQKNKKIKNKETPQDISDRSSKVRVLVVETDEALQIAMMGKELIDT